MDRTSICPHCGKAVAPVKKLRWRVFIPLIFTVVGAFVYLAYFLAATPSLCPACGRSLR